MAKPKVLILLIIAMAMALTLSCCQNSSGTTSGEASASDAASGTTSNDTDAVLKQLFDQQQSDVQVSGSGTVIRLLADDTEGAQHQRFILELASGQTLLIAHNISIAPRLDGLAVGDTVGFYGEYVYSAQGGTIHWTHRDPQGSHVAGWLEWNGKRYQ